MGVFPRVSPALVGDLHPASRHEVRWRCGLVAVPLASATLGRVTCPPTLLTLSCPPLSLQGDRGERGPEGFRGPKGDLVSERTWVLWVLPGQNLVHGDGRGTNSKSRGLGWLPSPGGRGSPWPCSPCGSLKLLSPNKLLSGVAGQGPEDH